MHQATTHERTQWWDIASVSILVIVLLLLVRYVVDFSIPPFEDAAMLMRYSQHVAAGHGIVWNIGEPPVDGATDFLFMIAAATLVRVGFSVEFAVRALGVGSHILTVFLVFVAVRYIHRGSVLVALTSALYLAIGPGFYYVAAYFGTPFFAFFASLTWCLAWLVARRPDSLLLATLFALAGLTTGLVRPEGVILATLMLVAIVFLLGWRRSRRVTLVFLLVFAVLGGLYFFWRWSYFGHPLPTPFVKKNAASFHPASLRIALRHTLIMCLPFIPVVILGLRTSRSLRLTTFALIPIAGFVCAFVLISNEMNFGGRFQYAVLPIFMISWYAIVHGIEGELRMPPVKSYPRRFRVALMLFAVVLALGALGYAHRISRTITYGRDGRYDVGRMLSDYAEDKLVLATSEAGLLPLYSRWRSVDTWGLNDPWIAQNGIVTNAYLNQYNPNVIMFHGLFSPLAEPKESTPWNNMTLLLRDYAEERGYILAAAYGVDPNDVHYYYVRPDFAQSAEIIDRLRSIEYYYYSTGTVATNYALIRAPGEWRESNSSVDVVFWDIAISQAKNLNP